MRSVEPNPMNQSRNHQSAKPKRKCFSCGKEGHIARYCRSKLPEKGPSEPGDRRANTGLPEEVPSRDDVFSRAVGKCPIANVKLGGVLVPCLLDSGSEVSTITESFFNENFRSKGFFTENFRSKGKNLLSTSGWLILRARCRNLGNNHAKAGNPGSQGLWGSSHKEVETRSAPPAGHERDWTGEKKDKGQASS